MYHHISRRDFLKYQVRGALALSAAASGLVAPARLFAAATPDIAVAKGSPGRAARAAVGLLGGMGAFVKAGNRVVIKPNMSFASPPERASNTHPEVVRELALMCKEAGAGRIMILDNPLNSPERCLSLSGIQAACAPIDREMVQMVHKPSFFKTVPIPGAQSLTETEVMREVLEADVLIAAPVAKSHSGAGVSLSMKGMMGLILDRGAMHGLDLNTAIVDLAGLLKPHLVVVDATRVLSTGGPGGPGVVLQPGVVIAARDMVAADAYTVSAFEWYGRRFKPHQVRYIRQAHERGLGRMDIDNMTVRSIAT
jgi:uncharacterized protein (DUF362 family)